MIIYTDMVADLFHRGHVEFLKKVRYLYPIDHLVIGVHSDKDVSTYKRKSIYSMDDRVEILKNTIFPDEVWSSAPLRISEEFIIDMVTILFVASIWDSNEEKPIPDPSFIEANVIDPPVPETIKLL